jgi:uncharacterized OB-fold protein
MTWTEEGIRDAGFDDWLDALSEGESYHLVCENGHASLPPRLVCPECGAALSETPMEAVGEVLTYTVVHVGTREFDGQTPYTVAIAEYGDVRVTGLVRGVDPEDVTVGMPVDLTVGENPSTDDRVVVHRAR